MLFFLLRSKSLSYGAAFIAVMSGFYLAATGAAVPMNQLTNAVVDAIRDL
ncbi:hypothetical protein [Streptomyces chrestomyceticus]